MEDTQQYIQLASQKVLVHFFRNRKKCHRTKSELLSIEPLLETSRPRILRDGGINGAKGLASLQAPPLRLNCLSPPSGWHSGSKKDELGYKSFFRKAKDE